MKTIKMQGCGNRFILVDEFIEGFLGNRKMYVIEQANKQDVDGVLFLKKSQEADLEMEIFDRDGTKESMCGNGLRCFARYGFDRGYIKSSGRIMTGDGTKEVLVEGNMVSVKMGLAREFRKLNERDFFVYMGVPHFVRFVESLDYDFSREEGRRIRSDSELGERLGHGEGINVNFVKVLGKSSIEIMTYEVGVEDITKACGTGATSSAYVASRERACEFPIGVKNLGGEIVIGVENKKLIMKGPAEYL